MDEEGLEYTLDEALDAVYLGNSKAVKTEWRFSSSQESLLTSIVFAGMLIGAYQITMEGSRKGLLGSVLLTSGAGLLSTFSPNYLSLLILRFLVGIGLGGGPVFSSWFLEFVPPANRGMWMVAFSTFWTFGTIFDASFAWIVMPRLGWRWLLAFSSLSSIALLFLYSIVPESPRYLCTKGRITDAHKLLEKIALINQAKFPHGMLVSDSAIGRDGQSPTSSHKPLLSSTRKKC